ncbi:MAG: RNA polymerase sigma factor [Myxococcota bacterium]
MVDEAAVADLYARYGHALFRRCRQLVGHDDDAKELVQETFFQFWKGRARFEERASPFTYLYRIATNLSIDKLRRRKTAGVQVDVDRADAAENGSKGPDRRVLAAQELASLTRGLDEETLTVAVMSHVDGLTQEEIAQALDLSRRTIGKRLKKFMLHTRKRTGRLDGKGAESVESAKMTGAHGL